MLWLVEVGSPQAEAALWSAPATADDLADAAPLTPSLGAARLHRRRLLRAYAARTLGVGSDEIRIERGRAGGQRIVAPELLFASIAARGAWTAIALSSHQMGVDIETRLVEQPLPTALLHPREKDVLAKLSGADRDLAFLRFWTAREAYLKAAGRGLPAELSSVEAKDDPDGQGVLLIETDVVHARATVTLTEDLVVAVVELRAPE